MKRSITILAAGAVLAACTTEIEDEAVNAYAFTASAETVREGEDISVHLAFTDAGFRGDNASWGDEWSKAEFHPVLKDSYGREVMNAVYSGPGGVLADGSVIDISRSGKIDIVIGSLREGSYTLSVNMRTRYTVDTWASVSFHVRERAADSPDPGHKVLVEDFTVPGSGNGLETETVGGKEYIILDLRFFNDSTPFVFTSRVLPENATDRSLKAMSDDPATVSASIRQGTLSTLVLVPHRTGRTDVTMASTDGAVTKSFGVMVIETAPDPDGFTLPTDDGERDAFDFDVAGRLALDINEYNAGNPFMYTCRPVPSNAAAPVLEALSDTPEVVAASVTGGNRLRLVPGRPGYATVTVCTSDGSLVRTMRVAVYSAFTVTAAAKEDEPSDDEKAAGVFPCWITFTSDSEWMPSTLFIDVYGTATGRIDLTDPADYFKDAELKNARSAFTTYEDRRAVVYLSNGNSAYDVCTNLQKKVTLKGTAVHHSDDWPKYYDYTAYYRLQSISLQLTVRESFDTNLYRYTLRRTYDSPANRIYQYLH